MESSEVAFDKHVNIKDFWFKGALKQDGAVALCKEQFSKLQTPAATQSIPKIIHFIWIGDNPVPPSFEIYKVPWYELHPDFEFHFWNEEQLSKHEWINSFVILDKTLNPGLRADALRLEILSKFGGIYVDLDMALFKPIHSLFAKFDTDFFICVSHTNVFEVNNAIIGCIKGHPFLDLLIKELGLGVKQEISSLEKQKQLLTVMAAYDPSIEDKLKELSSKKIDVIKTSGPGFVTRQLFKHLSTNKDTKILILPIEYYYPLSN